MNPILIAAAAGTLLTTPATDLISRHEPGETRRTTFEHESTSSLVEMTMLMNGEEAPEMGDMQQEQTRSRTGVFVDTTVGAEDGRRIAFEREYLDLAESASMSMTDPMGEDLSRDSSSESDLEGLEVLFTLDGESFAASYGEGEAGDDDLLRGLEADLPWAEFLPGEGVDVGDEWKVEATALWRALNLGGDLAFVSSDADPGMLSDDAPTDIDSVDLDGEITATLAELTADDGVSLARITLQIDVAELQDMSEMMKAMESEAPDDAPEGMLMPDIESMERETEYEGEGTLVWNVDGGYLVRLDLALEFTETQSISMSMDMGSESMELEQISVSEGEATFSVEVEVE